MIIENHFNIIEQNYYCNKVGMPCCFLLLRRLYLGKLSGFVKAVLKYLVINFIILPRWIANT